MDLDQFQNEAADADEGPYLVVAGPGSGKTRTLVERVARLIQKRVVPDSILAITFSKPAAVEMQKRVASRISVEVEVLEKTVRTFHSLSYGVILRDRWAMPFQLAPKPADPDACRRLLYEVMQEIKKSHFADVKYGRLKSFIASMKRNDISAEEAICKTAKDQNPDILSVCYSLYEKKKQERGILDFDDMIFYCWRLLRSNLNVRRKWQEQFKYVMVDEAHDTNHIQMQIAMVMAEPERNFFCVGDPGQAIYCWRGADPSLILNFNQYYPDVKTIHLGRNYRSIPSIIKIFKGVIGPGKSHPPGFLDSIVAVRESNAEVPEPQEFVDEVSEANWITSQIKSDREAKLFETAILVRTNRQTAIFEELLFKNEIPYVIEGSLSFFQRAEIKDFLAFLRIVEDPNDNEAFKRILLGPYPCSRYLGKAVLERLQSKSGSWMNNLVTVDLGQQYRTRRAHELFQFLSNLKEDCRGLAVAKQLEYIASKTMISEANTDNQDDDDRIDNVIEENIPELIRAADPFKTRKQFLNYIDTLSAGQKKSATDENSPVRIMTIHRSKGLEFETVFVAGVHEGVIPHKMSSDEEEERRILYVATSRAKDRLFLTCHGEPSRFLGTGIVPNETMEKEEAGI